MYSIRKYRLLFPSGSLSNGLASLARPGVHRRGSVRQHFKCHLRYEHSRKTAWWSSHRLLQSSKKYFRRLHIHHGYLRYCSHLYPCILWDLCSVVSNTIIYEHGKDGCDQTYVFMVARDGHGYHHGHCDSQVRIGIHITGLLFHFIGFLYLIETYYCYFLVVLLEKVLPKLLSRSPCATSPGSKCSTSQSDLPPFA